ncbi:acyl carrier protein [Micromonospora sp. WMMD1120]|uniref:acyl carrier protein n=1 Tax=Micromonospora sp. WMMD1120 TaxID=3016106 RepID=UPI0024179623|nr:acyl carrier protein [Micromonospora sp. WMMD1120]MDG4810871.1 acyl carrier protein [Micromonospora sp. WMMD1120]
MELDLRRLTQLMVEFGDRDATVDVDLSGDVGDCSFESLGFDSLALFNTFARIEQDYGVSLPLDSVLAAGTPNELLRLTNAQLSHHS